MPKDVFYKIAKDKQNSLLKRSLKEFAYKPYSKITVLSLTETMEILRTDFYYYFQDKDDIFSAILKEFDGYIEKFAKNPTLNDAFMALLEYVNALKGVRIRVFALELLDSYHPQALDPFVEHLIQKYPYNDGHSAEYRRIVIKNNLSSLINVLREILRGTLTIEEGREIMKNSL